MDSIQTTYFDWKLQILIKNQGFQLKTVDFDQKLWIFIENHRFQLKTTDLRLNVCEITFSFSLESGAKG